MSEIYAWEGVLDPTHNMKWVANYVVTHRHVPGRVDGALVYDGSWHLPPDDDDDDERGMWVTLNGENVVPDLADRRVRVTIEVVTSDDT